MAAKQQKALAEHRDGDPKNEMMLNNPPIPLIGGPCAGKVVHQPNEVSEIEINGAKYRRTGGLTNPQYVFVTE